MISFGSKVTFPVTKTIKIEDAYNMVKGEIFKKKIESVRNGIGEKKFLPFFSAPIFNKHIGRDKVYDGMATNSYFKYSRYMIFDLDKVIDVNREYDKITAIPYCVFAFKSPSGNGVKMFCRIATIHNPHLFKYSYVEYLNMFADRYGIEFDRETKDARRLCFVSYDPEAYLNLRAGVLPMVTPNLPEVKKVSEMPRMELPDDIVEVLISGKHSFGHGDWLRIACSLATIKDGKEIFMRISDRPDAGKKFDRFIGNVRDISINTLFWYYRKIKEGI